MRRKSRFFTDAFVETFGTVTKPIFVFVPYPGAGLWNRLASKAHRRERGHPPKSDLPYKPTPQTLTPKPT